MGWMLSKKLYESRTGYLQHWCPGCNQRHEIATQEKNDSGAVWAWDGDMDHPTFTPSIHIKYGPWTDDDGTVHAQATACHYFLRGGMLQFQNDCQHKLAGKTVPLPDWPAHAYPAGALR